MDEADRPEYCGAGIRGVAALVDSPAWLVAFFLATFAVGALSGDLRTSAGGVSADLHGAPALAAIVVALALGVAYHAAFEWRFGQTPGKRLVKIEVRMADGSPPDRRASLVRNGLRVVDWLPAFYAVGIASLLASDRQERLGDRLAGTVVVRQ